MTESQSQLTRMSIAVIAYPKFIPNENKFFSVNRTKYPKLTYPKFESHFTLIFPQVSVPLESLVEHVQAVVVDQPAIPFSMRRVQAVADVLSDNTYLFLVPDEGYEAVFQLHDRLYTGVLAAELRTDIPFIPHITIGYTSDAAYCRQIADEWNAQTWEIMGRIELLDVVELSGDSGQTVAQIALGAQDV
jgi:2'-5' RNA ligase